ncbi:FecR family protein [Chitinophaga solisilvae]|uniref:FecR family protein n=1 Tax=Chitinophaga solisilvae TaxID=1233460 RepID=UPI00136E7065|nr:FecR domain-containing protein [Chitinophaga solisilvae]
MGRKLAGEASAEELQELELLLRAHPEQHFPAHTMTELWNGPAPEDTDHHAAAAHDRHIQRMQARGIAIGDDAGATETTLLQLPESGVRRRYWRIAAAVAAVMMAAAAWWLAPAGKTQQLSEVATRNGARTSIELPDGTRVWLNAGSKLTYDKNFGLHNRNITLSGEAFFDVSKQAEHPFVIHTTAVNIRVLGTKFNIRSYPGDHATEAALLSGSIEASLNNSQEKIILRPTEKIIVQHTPAGNKESRTGRKTAIAAVAIQHLTYYEAKPDAIVETSWMENKLMFRDMSFAELAQDMERFYGVRVRLTNPQQAGLRFTGTFQKENIQQALDALRMTADFQYKITAEEIVIY